MIDYHSSVPVNNQLKTRVKQNNFTHPTLLFSARPKLSQLPFLNNLKVLRQLLVSLKNQKLRKSLYVVAQGCENGQSEGNEILRHQKTKLSVMDLISQEGKFEQLQNTIKSNINRQTMSPIQLNPQQQIKKQPKEFTITNDIFQIQKEKREKEIKQKKPTILSRKNYLAQQLNVIGHELEQTYLEVEQLQQIFQTLCNYYSDNRKIVDKNLKLKQQRDLIHQKIQQYQHKIQNNQRQQIFINDQLQQFYQSYRQILTKYLKQTLSFNHQNRKILSNINQHQLKSISSSQQPQAFNNQKTQLQLSNKQPPQQNIQNKSFQINLKFRNIKSQLERIKNQKKAAALNKNKQRKAKNQSFQNNTFNKLYVSEIYS